MTFVEGGGALIKVVALINFFGHQGGHLFEVSAYLNKSSTQYIPSPSYVYVSLKDNLLGLHVSHPCGCYWDYL